MNVVRLYTDDDRWRRILYSICDRSHLYSIWCYMCILLFILMHRRGKYDDMWCTLQWRETWQQLSSKSQILAYNAAIAIIFYKYSLSIVVESCNVYAVIWVQINASFQISWILDETMLWFSCDESLQISNNTLKSARRNFRSTMQQIKILDSSTLLIVVNMKFWNKSWNETQFHRSIVLSISLRRSIFRSSIFCTSATIDEVLEW